MNHRMIQFRCTALSVFLLLAASAASIRAHTHPTPTKTPSANVASTEDQPPKETEPVAEITELPNYHPLVVHFPVVLLLMAALFQLLSFFVYREAFSLVTLILLFLGVVSVWLAINPFHADPRDLNERASEVFRLHELMADYTWWISLSTLVAKAGSHFLTKREWWSEGVVMLALIACGITVSIGAHYGGQLVHIEGVGPQGKYLEMEGH